MRFGSTFKFEIWKYTEEIWIILFFAFLCIAVEVRGVFLINVIELGIYGAIDILLEDVTIHQEKYQEHARADETAEKNFHHWLENVLEATCVVILRQSGSVGAPMVGFANIHEERGPF